MKDAPFLSARDEAGRAHRWLTGKAWPLWLEHGVDWDRGAFQESLELHSLGCPARFRRLRVAARQTYVFARAAALGCPRAPDAAALGLHFLKRRALQESGGYAQRFDLAGMILDPSISTYDQAFVLLAYATAGLRAPAIALMEFLDRHCRHAAGGYVESLPPKLPRQQNTHLHLYEAFLAAADAFEDAVFLDRAAELRRLFEERLFQRSARVLPEGFSEGLTPIEQNGRYRVEPGHHCEWFWLLARHFGPGRDDRPSPRRQEIFDDLMAFVRRHGIDPATGHVLDEVWSDGSPSSSGSRLWPQAELIKAECVPVAGAPGSISGAYQALRRHLDPAPPGLWVERIGANGTPIAGPAPASSLYHLTCAILEGHDKLKVPEARVSRL